MNLRSAIEHGVAILAGAGIEGPRREARLLLEGATGLTREELLRDPDRSFPLGPYEAFLARRAGREPLAYVLGWTEFWSLRLRVSPATLIPRPDSETLIEAALARGGAVGSVLDLGTGTGCLLLAALTEFRGAWGVGTELNPAAARLAAENAASLGLAARAHAVCGGWAAPIAGRFDLVLSNPPYVRHADIPALQPEVARFEPGTALDGGPDGLDSYRAIIAELPRLLAPDGAAILELGIGQADAVAAIAREAGFMEVTCRPDLAGIPRALLIEAN